MDNGTINIVQISDLHLFDNPRKELLRVNTESSFLEVLSHIKENVNHMDCIILSGDLSQDGTYLAYQRIAQHIKQFKVPVYYVPGNHDDVAVMESIYPLENISNDKNIVFPQWQLVLLNSQIPGRVVGTLTKSQIDFLIACLDKYPEKNTVVIFHHQPVPIGAIWLDKLGINNAEHFWQSVSSFKNMHSIFYGHVHQDNQQKKNGVMCYAVPSTCFQFKRQQNQFGLELVPPGYRIIQLFSNGQLITQVYRVKKYIGIFDVEATGY